VRVAKLLGVENYLPKDLRRFRTWNELNRSLKLGAAGGYPCKRKGPLCHYSVCDLVGDPAVLFTWDVFTWNRDTTPYFIVRTSMGFISTQAHEAYANEDNLNCEDPECPMSEIEVVDSAPAPLQLRVSFRGISSGYSFCNFSDEQVDWVLDPDTFEPLLQVPLTESDTFGVEVQPGNVLLTRHSRTYAVGLDVLRALNSARGNPGDKP